MKQSNRSNGVGRFHEAAELIEAGNDEQARDLVAALVGESREASFRSATRWAAEVGWKIGDRDLRAAVLEDGFVGLSAAQRDAVLGLCDLLAQVGWSQ